MRCLSLSKTEQYHQCIKKIIRKINIYICYMSNKYENSPTVEAEKDISEKLVTRTSIIGDIIRENPFAVEIFMDYGVHCVGCHVSDFETLEQGILGHGFSEGELLDIINELNELILNPPENYDAV